MIKLYVNRPQVTIELQGPVTRIVDDLLNGIRGIHDGLLKNDEVTAMAFRHLLRSCLEEGSPVWEPADSAVTIDFSKKKWRCPHRSKLGHRTI